MFMAMVGVHHWTAFFGWWTFCPDLGYLSALFYLHLCYCILLGLRLCSACLLCFCCFISCQMCQRALNAATPRTGCGVMLFTIYTTQHREGNSTPDTQS